MSDQDSLFNFPCPFPIKVMGLSGHGLEELVLTIVKKHAPDTCKSDISIRPSKKGKYSAVTATITATSRKQLDSIYLDLTACEKILMAL